MAPEKLVMPQADLKNMNEAFGDIYKPEILPTDAFVWRVGVLFETGTGLGPNPIYLGLLFYLRGTGLDSHGCPVWQKLAFFDREWKFKVVDQTVAFWKDLGNWLDRSQVGMRTWDVSWDTRNQRMASAVSYSFETRLLRPMH